MASNDELACTYAALIMADDGVSVTAEKIQAVLKAAGVDVEPYWPGLFAKAVEGMDIKDMVTKIGEGAGSGGGVAAAGAAADTAPAEEKKEEPKKEESEESDDDMGFGLFD